jgi:molybdenum ABC transporter, periplasmic molybdate-binding protein
MKGFVSRRWQPSRSWLTAVLLFVCLNGITGSGLLGCNGSRAGENELTVFTASSLAGVFAELGRLFEAQHAGQQVIINQAGSQTLRVQIENGAPADVFASADAWHVDALRERGLVETSFVFARNELVVIVPRDNPAGLRSVADLPHAERIVVGAADVPVGSYTRQFLDRASMRYGANFRQRVEQHVVSHELSVRQVLAKVGLNEADAGVVYRTDAMAAPDRVQQVLIPTDMNVIAEYHIGLLKAAPHPTLAQAWLDLVRSHAGQSVLGRHGFMGTGEF